MSLATRCPNCKTIFQFPPSLISKSGGWAKCRRCQEVFNAAAYLVQQSPDALSSPTQLGSAATANGQNSVSSVKTNSAELANRADKKNKTRIEPSGFSLESLYPYDAATDSATPPPAPAPISSSSSRSARGSSNIVTPSSSSRGIASSGSSGQRTSTRSQDGLPSNKSSTEQKFVPSQPPFGSSRETLAGREVRRTVSTTQATGQRTRPPGAIPRSEVVSENQQGTKTTDTKRRSTSALSSPSFLAPNKASSAAKSNGNSNSQFTSSTAPNSSTSAKQGVAIDTVSIIDPLQQAKKSKQEFIRNKKLLWLGSIVAIAMLFLQITLSERNRLATYFPATQIVLKPMCQLFACTIEPLKLAEAVAIENSSFHINGPEQTGNAEEQYQLTWSVSNKALHEVAIPHLELTLNDVLDRPLLRRVLTAQDLGFSQKTITAEGVWEGSTIITVVPPEGGGRVSGYRLTAFYP